MRNIKRDERCEIGQGRTHGTHASLGLLVCVRVGACGCAIILVCECLCVCICAYVGGRSVLGLQILFPRRGGSTRGDFSGISIILRCCSIDVTYHFRAKHPMKPESALPEGVEMMMRLLLCGGFSQ